MYTVKVVAPPLTPKEFRANPATGTMKYPQRINNGSTRDAGLMRKGDYAEIELPGKYSVREFRYHGSGSHEGNGEYKTQYWDGSKWVDWETGIPTRGYSWSPWNPTTPVETEKIRIVATKLDSGPFWPKEEANLPVEWEFRG